MVKKDKNSSWDIGNHLYCCDRLVNVQFGHPASCNKFYFKDGEVVYRDDGGRLAYEVVTAPGVDPTFNRRNLIRRERSVGESSRFFKAEIGWFVHKRLSSNRLYSPGKLLPRDVDPVTLRSGKTSDEADSDSGANHWDLALQEWLPLART